MKSEDFSDDAVKVDNSNLFSGYDTPQMAIVKGQLIPNQLSRLPANIMFLHFKMSLLMGQKFSGF